MKAATAWGLLSLLAIAALVAPVGAQNLRPMVAPSNINQIQIDYKAQWEKERARNTELRAEIAVRFDERVLEEALDLRHPLLERLKFLSIFSSNLD